LKNVPLGSVCEINPPRKLQLNPESECSFIPMEYIDDRSGTIIKKSIRRLKEVENGYTHFQDKDILFAKITPCMENGKCAIAKNLMNGIGFGSTEFHVIQAREQILPEWVYYYLRQERTRKNAELNMTGSAGQKRVPSSFLKDILIPLPPLPEQKRIAALLEKADRLRQQRRYALELSDTYLQTVFLVMFGDPTMNQRHWELNLLSKEGVLDRGKSQHRPRDAAHLYGGPYPFIQTGDGAVSIAYGLIVSMRLVNDPKTCPTETFDIDGYEISHQKCMLSLRGALQCLRDKSALNSSSPGVGA
jgi:type I restriction enzyme, S subunit